MSRTGALLLIAAASTSGAYVYLLPPSDTSTELAEITRISAAPDRDHRGVGAVSTPTFAPTPALFSEVISDEPEETAAVSPPKPGTWTTVVMSGQVVLSPLKSSRPADAPTRIQLARDLQRGLQHAGCYQGSITGAWSASTRRAMAAFMDRANAVLPFKDPDYVLLALVQNHREITCTAECPSGQAMDDGGRCVPHAILAQTARKSQSLDEQQLADSHSTEDHDYVARPEVLPWQRNQVAADPLSRVATEPRAAPSPGRMSIGGPVDLAPSESSETVATSPQWTTVSAGAAPGGDGADATAKVAALQAEPDSDSLSDDANTTQTGALPVATDADGPAHKFHPSESDRRRRHDSYASAGRRRHGDPRPGTARFNLMQSLGGVY